MRNIYPTLPGFGLRVHHARTAIKKYAVDSEARPYSRGFDNCFENWDGDAVVWQIMRDIINGDEILERGVRKMGGQLFADWMDVYDPGTRQRIDTYQETLSLGL